MILELTNDYIESVYELGELLNKNYRKLYDLSSFIKDDYNYIFIYLKDDKVVGFIHVTKIFESVDVINIVVDEKFRHQGIASRLFNYLLNKFDDIENITLEVNVNNIPAINLYKKFGFEIVNIRKSYYNGEDGYLMSRSV